MRQLLALQAMVQAAISFRIGSKVKIDLDSVRDRIPNSLQQLLRENPRGTLLDWKMTDGTGIGVVLELSDGTQSWFFENEIGRA